jgi:amphi-Trp domain-containing protein
MKEQFSNRPEPKPLEEKMEQEKILFKSEEPRTAAEAANFLRQLATKVEQRQITLRRGAEELILELPETLTIELKAEEEIKKGKTTRSLEIELEWFEDGAGGKVELL